MFVKPKSAAVLAIVLALAAPFACGGGDDAPVNPLAPSPTGGGAPPAAAPGRSGASAAGSGPATFDGVAGALQQSGPPLLLRHPLPYTIRGGGGYPDPDHPDGPVFWPVCESGHLRYGVELAAGVALTDPWIRLEARAVSAGEVDGADLSPVNPDSSLMFPAAVLPSYGGLSAAHAPDRDSVNGVVAVDHSIRYRRSGVDGEFTVTAYFRLVDRDDVQWSAEPAVCGSGGARGPVSDPLDGVPIGRLDVAVHKPTGYAEGSFIPICEGARDPVEFTLTNGTGRAMTVRLVPRALNAAEGWRHAVVPVWAHRAGLVPPDPWFRDFYGNSQLVNPKGRLNKIRLAVPAARMNANRFTLAAGQSRRFVVESPVAGGWSDSDPFNGAGRLHFYETHGHDNNHDPVHVRRLVAAVDLRWIDWNDGSANADAVCGPRTGGRETLRVELMNGSPHVALVGPLPWSPSARTPRLVIGEGHFANLCVGWDSSRPAGRPQTSLYARRAAAPASAGAFWGGSPPLDDPSIQFGIVPPNLGRHGYAYPASMRRWRFFVEWNAPRSQCASPRMWPLRVWARQDADTENGLSSLVFGGARTVHAPHPAVPSERLFGPDGELRLMIRTIDDD